MGSVYELVGAQEMIYSTKELSWEEKDQREKKNAENYEMFCIIISTINVRNGHQFPNCFHSSETLLFILELLYIDLQYKQQ